MPRNITITFEDGTSHVYQGAPDALTPQDVEARATKDFGKRVTGIDGGSKEPAKPVGDAANGGKVDAAVMGFNDLPIAAGQILQNIPGVDKALNLVRTGVRGGLNAVGAKDTAELFGDVSKQDFNNRVKSREQQYEADKQAAGREGFDWSRLAGSVANPLGLAGGGGMKTADTLWKLAFAGAKAGATGAVLQPVTNGGEDFWTDKAGQAAAGAATGAVLTPVVSKVATGVVKGAKSAFGAIKNAITPQNIDVAVTNTFMNQGINPGDVPDVILQSVQRQVKEALDAGAKIDPASMIRKAQFEAVGLTGDAAPTVGQATRDAMQFAAEKNLSGVNLGGPKGNQLSQRFQTQNQRLGEVFDQVGAKGATDRVTAGQTMIDALKASDQPAKAGVDAAYETARGMSGGRVADLERGTFTQTANDALDKGMWGHFVPPEVRSLLNSITEGKTPFNVESAVQIDSILSSSQRSATRAGNDAQAAAIGVIRDALHSTPLAKVEQAGAKVAQEGAGAAAANAARTVDEGVTDVTARMQPQLPKPAGTALAQDFEIPLPRQGTAVGPAIPPGSAPIDEGAAARAAFDQARKAARARFSTIEQTPALKAALDEAAPDKFVQQFVLNADVRDVQAMKKVLENSPEALDQARAQVADHLKRAAFGENPSGDKGFAADRYLKTLQAIGKQKLEAFFTPAEIVRLNLAGKVASDINSIPVGAKYGTNTSGTGAALMNLLTTLTDSPLMRQIPGARFLANQVGEIKTERAINSALNPALEKVPVEVSPESARRLRMLLPFAGSAGGALGGHAVP